MEPVGVDQEHGGDDDDPARQADCEEDGGEDEPPESELGRADGVRQVEHVPGEPDQERAQQQAAHHQRHRTGEERPESQDCEHPREHPLGVRRGRRLSCTRWSGTMAPVRVLIVEDEPHMAELIGRGLAKEGMAVDIASTGEQAIEMAGAAPTTTPSSSTCSCPGSTASRRAAGCERARSGLP